MAELLTQTPTPDPSSESPVVLPPQCLLATTCIQALAQGGKPDGRDKGSEPDAGPAGQVISAVQRLGATALHLSEGPIRGFLAELVVELLLRRAELPVVAVDATLGAIRLGRPRAALACAGSLDRREAEEATAVATAALSLAAELGAPFVALRLGAVAGLTALWEKARSHFLRGALASDEAPAEELMQARSAGSWPRRQRAFQLAAAAMVAFALLNANLSAIGASGDQSAKRPIIGAATSQRRSSTMHGAHSGGSANPPHGVVHEGTTRWPSTPIPMMPTG